MIPEFVVIEEHHLEELRRWMDNPDDNSECRELLFFEPPSTDHHLPETDIPPSATLHYYQLLIKRKRVNCAYKYWVDIAYRADTGEPLLFVSHEGNIDEYYRELTAKKGKQ